MPWMLLFVHFSDYALTWTRGSSYFVHSIHTISLLSNLLKNQRTKTRKLMELFEDSVIQLYGNNSPKSFSLVSLIYGEVSIKSIFVFALNWNKNDNQHLFEGLPPQGMYRFHKYI